MEYLNESSKKVRVRKELEKTIHDIKNGWDLRAKGFKQKKKNLWISEETNLTPANFSDLRKFPKE